MSAHLENFAPATTSDTGHSAGNWASEVASRPTPVAAGEQGKNNSDANDRLVKSGVLTNCTIHDDSGSSQNSSGRDGAGGGAGPVEQGAGASGGGAGPVERGAGASGGGGRPGTDQVGLPGGASGHGGADYPAVIGDGGAKPGTSHPNPPENIPPLVQHPHDQAGGAPGVDHPKEPTSGIPPQTSTAPHH